ncbi:putative membrane protein YeiH [Aliiruegeria haliotis]|uniref:Putative membrane protein YeiH n=1 Tax=Aliiruegeria haliotis TaxID=1280846 RepID=A0A2T0RTD5_9RHOB|nr:trimeric intracellular cation channel family protein [Aliiruegeria haliotis]PRY24370.1 putative membrane protein YeiH [Aliiruegeria haliotis]
MTFAALTVLLTILATATMAASAAIQAVRHEFDAFGATVLAMTTALGGGTVRDLLIGRTPVFWITDLTYIATTIPTALGTYWLATRMASGNGRRERLLLRFDAIGLALFTLVGIGVANQAATTPVIAVIIGCITGTVGGMIRDMLCNETPTILRRDLYATISLAGGALYLGLATIAPDPVAIGVSFAAMLATRLLVIERNSPT